MGAGKSTVGRAIAARTGWAYLDNDELVKLATDRPTPEVLAGSNEATLRRVERAALDAALAAPTPLVASVAAGVILDASARLLMHDGTFVVYLRATLATLTARVGDGSGRPWLGDDVPGALARLLDGREALKTIKDDPSLSDIPIVVLSTSHLDEDIARSYQLGVNSFITKPVTFSGLVEAMNVLGRYWLAIVELPPTAA